MNDSVRYYLSVFLRRIHYFLVVFGIVAAASFSVARILPPVYVSQARLLVESAQIPSELAAATVNTGATEQLQIIEQRLLTRANLLDISRRLNVFDNITTMSADEIVSQMRAKSNIVSRSGRGQATFMTISFESDSASVAANVANEFVTLILQDNVEIRTGRAGDTFAFFEQEVNRLDSELARQSAFILEFKDANSDALPDILDYRLSQQSRLQERLTTIEREISSLNEQKRRLAQIFEATGRIVPLSEANQTPEQIQLTRLEDELRNALSIYSPENPKIKLLEAQIAQLKVSVSGQPNTPDSGPLSQSSVLDIQLADIDARIDSLNSQIAQINAESDELKDSLSRTPAISIALSALERDYTNIQLQFNTAVDRLAKAATGERIELLAKGQRIAILDAAAVPSKPTKPNRSLIAVAGAVAGAGLGLGLIVLLEVLNTAIRRPVDVSKNLGITPITTIPYIRTPMELVFRRAIFVLLFVFVVVGLPSLLFAVHLFYLPLDLIYDRMAGQVAGLF